MTACKVCDRAHPVRSLSLLCCFDQKSVWTFSQTELDYLAQMGYNLEDELDEDTDVPALDDSAGLHQG